MNTLYRDIEEAESATAHLRGELTNLRAAERDLEDRLREAERKLAALRQQECDYRQAQRAARDRQGEVAACDDGTWEAGCGVEVVCR